mmetsp:Transcript_11527/g.35818  ORF Transcript_11527/g.35818 Transcript_11527/m.35818 type:complete len:213 (-) Transcript_11527:420-1058(-)
MRGCLHAAPGSSMVPWSLAGTDRRSLEDVLHAGSATNRRGVNGSSGAGARCGAPLVAVAGTDNGVSASVTVGRVCERRDVTRVTAHESSADGESVDGPKTESTRPSLDPEPVLLPVRPLLPLLLVVVCEFFGGFAEVVAVTGIADSAVGVAVAVWVLLRAWGCVWLRVPARFWASRRTKTSVEVLLLVVSNKVLWYAVGSGERTLSCDGLLV